MPTIRELAEQLWNGDVDTQAFHPVAFRQPVGEEIADGVLYYKGIASANTIDTGDGLVMLDTGAVNDTRTLFEEVRKWRRDAPLRAAVFFAPPRRPHLRRRAVRSRSGRKALAAASGLRPRTARFELRPLQTHPRLEHRHQPSPVRDRCAAVQVAGEL